MEIPWRIEEAEPAAYDWCRARVQIDLIKMRALVALVHGVSIRNSYAHMGFRGIEPFVMLVQTLSNVEQSETITRKRRRPSAEALVALAVFEQLHYKQQKQI